MNVYLNYLKKRSDRQKARREEREETRDRIVEALAPIMKGFDGHFTNLADSLACDLSNGKPSDSLRFVARHLARFSAWQSLSQETLSVEEIAQVGLK